MFGRKKRPDRELVRIQYKHNKREKNGWFQLIIVCGKKVRYCKKMSQFPARLYPLSSGRKGNVILEISHAQQTVAMGGPSDE